MTIPEQAVQAAANAAHEELLSKAKQMNVPMEYTQSISVSNYHVMRAALTTAAPHLAAVQVNGDALKLIERMAFGYETMFEKLCHISGTSGESQYWYMSKAREATDRISPLHSIMVDSNKAMPGDCKKQYLDFMARILSALETYAGRAAVLEEAAKIAFDVSENGEYHGEASVDSASSIYQQGAYEVYEAIRALHPQADKPSNDGAQGEGWMPIESAPKDGTPFLVFVPDDEFSDGTGIDVIWYDEEQWLFGSNTPFSPANAPTHWRPLPTPPAGEVA